LSAGFLKRRRLFMDDDGFMLRRRKSTAKAMNEVDAGRDRGGGGMQG
jgi:hypothetical protein